MAHRVKFSRDSAHVEAECVPTPHHDVKTSSPSAFVTLQSSYEMYPCEAPPPKSCVLAVTNTPRVKSVAGLLLRGQVFGVMGSSVQKPRAKWPTCSIARRWPPRELALLAAGKMTSRFSSPSAKVTH